LPLQLIVLTVLPLTALLFLIAFGSLVIHQRAMRSLVGERDQRAARAAAGAITEQLNKRAVAVRSLVLQAAAAESPEEVLATSAFLLPDFEEGLAFYRVDGSLLAASNDAAIWQERGVGQRLQTADGARDSQSGAIFLPVFTDPASGQLVMLVAAAAPDGLTAVGAFLPENVARRALVDIFSSGEEASALVVSAAGDLLYQIGSSPTNGGELSGQPGVTDALRGDSGTTYLSLEGDEYVLGFSPISPVNWALVIEEPWQIVADPLLRTSALGPLVLAPALIFALLVLWFGVRQIVRPLQALQQRAADLAWGNFKAIEKPVGGIEEIRRLQTALVDMARKLQAAQQGLRSYLGAITAGQEEERRRLARELHDDTLQSLIALNQRAQLAQIELGQQEPGQQEPVQQELGQQELGQQELGLHPTAEKLGEIQQMTTQLITDLRRFTRDLRPTYLEDLGLVPALDMLARDMSQQPGVHVQFKSTGTERRPPPEIELALYRMAQEALNNVTRHAEASEVLVRLIYQADKLQVAVSDNGRGFEVPESPAELARAGHFGLLGLQERAELIGAQLAIESQPGQGTSVTVTVPLPPEEEVVTSGESGEPN
jgi:signal transduction histidine kinase